MAKSNNAAIALIAHGGLSEPLRECDACKRSPAAAIFLPQFQQRSVSHASVPQLLYRGNCRGIGRSFPDCKRRCARRPVARTNPCDGEHASSCANAGSRRSGHTGSARCAYRGNQRGPRTKPPAQPTPTPAAAIGAPAPPAAAVAPLSAAIPSSTALATGGSSGVSLPGGGHEGLQACLEFWDRETHMTKAEWKVACQDSIRRRASISLDETMPKPAR
jgi:hypothetical protein